MTDWGHLGTAVTASFLASLVEFAEALTIVLAVGTVRGWRPALIGTAAGMLLLTGLVLFFGPALQQVPLTTLQLIVGVLLLLFGMRWLRKAILRSAGIIGLHNEEAIYRKQTDTLRADTLRADTLRADILRADILREDGSPQPAGLDKIAVLTTFKAVSLEGLEVIFIVIATGAAGHTLVPAACGAAAAGVLVVLMGLALRQPLTRIPENTLKYAVGVLLSAFGVFWVGEGLRLG